MTNRRALTAAALLTVLVVSLLAAWFVSGWRDVRMRQAEIRKAPYAAADRRALELAQELRAELDALLAREVRRPYFHYQNLMHDPQTSAGVSVSRSPLAAGPEERLVLGYFQVDAKGRATTPTLNDEVPELSASLQLAGHRAFRDEVARDLARQLAPAQTPRAQLSAKSVSPPRARPPEQPVATAEPGAQSASQVITLDPKIYAQNANANAVFHSQQALSGTRNPPPIPAPAPPPAPVTITISPLEWRTMAFAAVPTLVATRQVQTPDQSFTQGFVVDQRSVTAWLAAKAGDLVPVLGADRALGVPVAPGWGLTVQPSADSLKKAADDGAAAAREFLIRFVAVGAVSVVAAGLVLLLVARAETLARERSQFAAAAAHELRTPLAGLQLYGDMLADGLGDPGRAQEYARRMSDDAARLGRVVSNILGFSQLERGNLAAEAQAGPLGEVLVEIAERSRPSLVRAGAALDVDVPRGLRARFDRDALARIVGNLLDNAEKFARHAGNRTIRLAALECGEHVEVSVADHGPGVADRSKLFHAFSRGATGGDAPAGLGLGLALSRSLARAMDGELQYRPSATGGAIFVLQLRR